MFDLRRKTNGRPLLVGHRGAMAIAPENSMPAFAAGWEGGADILELDVQLTADNQVIVFHDIELEMKTGVPGKIADYEAAFLQSLDVGTYFSPDFAGVQMPLLAEVLAWAKGRVALMIELKHSPPHFDAELDRQTVNLIEKYEMEDKVVITSFDQFALQRINQFNANISTSFIYVARLCDPLALVQGLDVQSLSPATDFMSQAEVKMIQNAGYACSPGGFYWDYPTLLAWGVDTISSNDPASFRELMRAHTAVDD